MPVDDVLDDIKVIDILKSRLKTYTHIEVFFKFWRNIHKKYPNKYPTFMNYKQLNQLIDLYLNEQNNKRVDIQ